MDTRTGDIYKLEQEMREKLHARMIQMKIPPTEAQLSRKPTNPAAIGRVGRNEPCPCGSGRKFKKCCYLG